jgi:hypothetical protein
VYKNEASLLNITGCFEYTAINYGRTKKIEHARNK